MKQLLAILATTALFLFPTIARAQTYQPSNRIPVPDNSQIGTQRSGTNNNFDITGGFQRGQHLFHSFLDFSVPKDGSANFIKPTGTQSIITRVTGDKFSDINGLVNTNGANFLLINPNGVVFGTNAKLNVGKALVTSTASGVDFVDTAGKNYNFGVNQAGDALLKIDPNVAFNPARLIMGGSSSKGIENYGTLETTNQGQYIGLIGGNITFNGGKINAPGGRVDLGGLSAPGAVGLGVEGNLPRAQFSTDAARGDISFTNGARVSVAGAGGGDIAITARNLEILSQSVIRGGIETGLGTPEAVAGDIKVNATGEFVIAAGSAIANNVRLNSQGKGGNIAIDAGGSFVLKDSGSRLQTTTAGIGDAGNIDIKTKGNITIIGTSNLTELQGTDLRELSGIDSNSQGKARGNAGQITINTKGKLSISNRSGIFNIIEKAAVGNSKGIKIYTGELELTNRGIIRSYTDQNQSVSNQGNAGNIDIIARGNITISGIDNPSISQRNLQSISNIGIGSSGKGSAGKVSIDTQGKLLVTNQGGIFSLIETNAEGDSQGLTIVAKELEVSKYSGISTRTTGKGNAGDINVKITNGNLTISGTADVNSDRNTNFSVILTNNNGSFKGNAGKINIINEEGNIYLLNRGSIQGQISEKATGINQGITIVSKELELRNSGGISSSLGGNGNAGKIKIITKGKILLSDSSSIINRIQKTGIGQSDGINISAGELELKNNSTINSETYANQQKDNNSGNINIVTKGTIGIVEKSGIYSSSLGKGDAGQISIDTQGQGKLSLSNNSLIQSGILKDGEGKSQGITISVNGLELKNTAYISSLLAGKGQAGDIFIKNTGDASISNLSEVIVSSQGQGSAGNISIISDILNFNNGKIFAKANSASGGNITLTLRDQLLMRNDSIIATDSTSTDPNGNGGNITINSPLIVTLPGNNDITANAIQGDGGKVNITSQGLFGIKYRPIGTDFTNDITASSTFGQNGSVQISTPGTDPGKNKGELAEAPNDASKQISQACGASQRVNKFYITGRGGLPPTASEALESEALWEDARAVKTKPTLTAIQPQQFTAPAVGWVFEPNGRVRLIAAHTGAGSTGTSVVCPTVGN